MTIRCRSALPPLLLLRDALSLALAAGLKYPPECSILPLYFFELPPSFSAHHLPSCICPLTSTSPPSYFRSLPNLTPPRVRMPCPLAKTPTRLSPAPLVLLLPAPATPVANCNSPLRARLPSSFHIAAVPNVTPTLPVSTFRPQVLDASLLMIAGCPPPSRYKPSPASARASTARSLLSLSSSTSLSSSSP
jgi:hypothetical protein